MEHQEKKKKGNHRLPENLRMVSLWDTVWAYTQQRDEKNDSFKIKSQVISSLLYLLGVRAKYLRAKDDMDVKLLGAAQSVLNISTSLPHHWKPKVEMLLLPPATFRNY